MLAHMDTFGEITVYDLGAGDIAYCFCPEDSKDESEDVMAHQGFAIGDSGFYLASAHGQDILLWQLGSTTPSLKGRITAHRARVVRVRGSYATARHLCPSEMDISQEQDSCDILTVHVLLLAFSSLMLAVRL